MHVAKCRCGRLQAVCSSEPVRVSVCHCIACQRRTGSAFSAQARFPATDVSVEGEASTYVRTADSGRRLTYRFCPACGSTVAYSIDEWPDVIAVPLGLFDGGDFPPPTYSIYERRKKAWASIDTPDVEHHD